MRVQVLLLIAVLAIACVRCAPARAQVALQPQPFSVTFVNPGKKGEVFWDLVSDSMHAASRSLGVRLEVIWAERSFRRMRELGREVVARKVKPDFLILVNEEAAAAPILEAAEEAGVKTLLLSNTLIDDDAARYGAPRQHLKYWIGSLVPDLEHAGARMATALIAAARKAGRVSEDGKIHMLALAGDERTPTSIVRNRGLQQVVAQNPDVVLDRLLFANWNEAEAQALSANYLLWAQRKNITVAAIWAANDPMAIGALTSAKRAGYALGRDLFVAGLNWSGAALESVRGGEMLLTDGGHFLGGAMSILLLRDYADGCDFAQTGTIQMYRTSAITQERAESTRAFVSGRAFERADYNRLRSYPKACGHHGISVDDVLRVLGSENGELVQ